MLLFTKTNVTANHSYNMEPFGVALGKGMPSVKLTAKAPENGWLEDEFPFGFRPIFRGCVSFREGRCRFLL